MWLQGFLTNFVWPVPAAWWKNLKVSSVNVTILNSLVIAILDEVQTLFANARFSVVPSEWYENNPFSVIESLCSGTPFVGADIGGIPELANNKNGVIFTPGDLKSLQFAIEEAWKRSWNYADMQQDALSRFSPDQHYAALDKIYNG